MVEYKSDEVVKVKAIQWTGENAAEVDNIISKSSGPEGESLVIGDEVLLNNADGMTIIPIGGYIVERITGDLFYCPQDEFSKSYELAPCSAPQDPNHVLTEAEVKRLAETGSLCDCMEVMQVFDECPIQVGDEFDFGSAVYLLKTGKKVARAGWNGKGMFVYYVPAASYPVERNNKSTMAGEFADDMVPYREYLALKTAQGDVATWAPSCSDALATDWMLYE